MSLLIRRACHRPKTKLSEWMVKQIKDSVADVDAAVLVTEPLGKIHPIELELLQAFSGIAASCYPGHQ